jgi:hypothetical protein
MSRPGYFVIITKVGAGDAVINTANTPDEGASNVLPK